MSRTDNKQRWGLAIGGILLTLLLAAVFTFGSLSVPFQPESLRAVVALYSVTSFITAALLVFGLILARSIARLWVEQSREQFGARFKTKMVLGATAISLLPIIFMFIVSYSLINRSLLLWFPKPLEVASDETQKLLNDLGRAQLPRLRGLAMQARTEAERPDTDVLSHVFAKGADALWFLDRQGKVLRGGIVCDNKPEDRSGTVCMQTVAGQFVRSLPSGVEIWSAGGKDFFAARVAASPEDPQGGSVIAGYRTSPNVLDRLTAIQRQTQEYYQEKQDLRALKRQMLLILLFFTVLLLSAVMWVALFLAKQVTIPIQALAEGTREVSSGNFDYQVPEQAQDELGILVRSFNTMTTQLRDSRSQIDQFTRNLQLAVQELERRRQLMETVLENIPTGVISLDAKGAILRVNSAVTRMFAIDAGAEPYSLEGMVGADAARIVNYLMRRSLRMGVVSREIETVAAGRVLHLAVTVSSLGPRRANSGFVLVLDDLTEVLRAQKSAAWQEVARRIAHEIKNPLTPIQLSAQRLLRFLERGETSQPVATRHSELAKLVQDCSRLIEREVSTLAELVNEFSQFVRFPTAKLVPTNANTVVQQALEVFSGRLDGITLKPQLAENLPQVRADSGLLRSVIVNLIDNAAEALESSASGKIEVSTLAHSEAETVVICVSDNGTGISPEDKDKLFLPHFSTKDRGTGLGLAIAARIVAEHGGSIHVEDNVPVGSRFLIELPAADLTPATVADHNGADTAR